MILPLPALLSLVFLGILIIFAIAIVILVVQVRHRLDTKPNRLEPDHGTNYLFFVSSDDNSTVSVIPQERELTLHLPTKTSSFTAFTNIPQHDAYNMGNLIAADLLFNHCHTRPLSLEGLPAIQKQVLQTIVNDREKCFIEEEPNCTLSFTLVGQGDVTHVNTIAKLTSLVNGTDGQTTMRFILLENQPSLAGGVYEHVAITIDDFWNFLSAIGASVGAALTCSVGEVGTAFAATAACAATIVAATGAWGTAVSS